MTEKPFQYKEAYSNIKSNFLYHEDLVNLLPKLLNEKGVLNIGGKTQSIFSFAKKSNPSVVSIRAKKNNKLPFNQTMNLNKLNSILKKINL